MLNLYIQVEMHFNLNIYANSGKNAMIATKTTCFFISIVYTLADAVYTG